MKTLTNLELSKRLAGGDSYIRTKNGVIRGLAITTIKNPEAPEIIVVGNGPRIVSNARLFLESQVFVPVFIKQKTNQWKYVGDFKAESYSRNKLDIQKHHGKRDINFIDGILFLSAKDDVDVSIKGRSLPDTILKKKIEIAAIEFVKNYYSNKNYKVTDQQSLNYGYDLLVENNKEKLKIEVKGTNSQEQRFFISRRERAKSVDPLWRLAIVTSALTNPFLEILNTEEMEHKFNFDALCWECT